MLALLRRDPAALAWVITRCIRIKAHVVARDERESGLRHILNFGHTLGHALEAATRYRRFLHGEAVAWGMLAATLFGLATGRLPESEATRVVRLISNVGPLPSLDGIRATRLRPILAGDKKARSGRVFWVLPRHIGKVQWGATCRGPSSSVRLRNSQPFPHRRKSDLSNLESHECFYRKADETVRHAAGWHVQ